MRRVGGRRAAAVMAVAMAIVGAACGNETTGQSQEPAGSTTTSGEQRAAGDPKLAGDAITAFGNDLFKAAAASAEGANLIVSPTSVAVAMAMTEPGATGEAQTEMRKLLRIEDPEAFHASMGALERSLEQRKARPAPEEDQKPGEVTMNVANAAYVMRGYEVKQAYLDAIKSHYGAAVESIDFAKSAEAAEEVNKFIAEATRDHIKDLVKDDTFDADTVMALVNALYLKASWLQTFDKAETKDEPFTRLDRSKVTVPLMRDASDSSNRGENWVGATKNYVGGLTAQFILPEDGAFDEVVADLPKVFADYQQRRAAGAELAVPKFKTRTETALKAPLTSLGLAAPFERGNFRGIADDPRLAIEDVLHATFLAMDEEGTEAAAATVVVMHATSGPVDPPEPVPVVLDRPFIFRIFDSETNATLFLGRVLDPTK